MVEKSKTTNYKGEDLSEKLNNDGSDSLSKGGKEDELIIVVPSKDGPNGFKCKLCDVFYPRKSYLKLHIRTGVVRKLDFNKLDPGNSNLLYIN